METLRRFYHLIRIRIFANSRKIQPIIAALEDPDDKVRAAAAKALGTIGDASSQAPLIAALADRDFAVRAAAAEALGAIGDTGSQAPLLALLTDSYQIVRSTVADALDRLAWEPAGNLMGVNYWIAKCAWTRCVEIGALAVEPLIAVALDDPSMMIRKGAAEALGKIRDNRAIQPLVTALDSGDLAVAVAAATALRNIGAPAIPALGIATETTAQGVRCAAAITVRQIGYSRAVDSLIEEIRRSTGSDQAAASAAIIGLGGIKAVTGLIACLNDSTLEVRLAAASALMELYSTALEGNEQSVIMSAIKSVNGFLIDSHHDHTSYSHDDTYCSSGGGYSSPHDDHSDSPERCFKL